MKSLLLAAALCGRLSAAEPPADLILRGGVVFVGPGRYASAIAVRGHRIAAVGDAEAVAEVLGPRTRVVELRGRAVTPGFHDAHVRLVDGSVSLAEADLAGAGDLAEIQARLKAFASAHPRALWLIGRSWDAGRFAQAPTSADLDVVSSTRPVALITRDGRRMVLNAEAMRATGAARTSDLKAGGRVVRDKNGRPTGLLLDEAAAQAARKIPRASSDARLAGLRETLELARREGITAFDAMPDRALDSAAELLDLWKRLDALGEATARLVVFGRMGETRAVAKLRGRNAATRTRVLIAGVAEELDGELERRAAALLAPYSDKGSDAGSLRHAGWSLAANVRAAHELGLQVALEAQGDRAVRQALDACAASQKKARDEGLVLPVAPCRVEGAVLTEPSDLPKLAALRAAVSGQPGTLVRESDAANELVRLLGGRVSFAYAWRSCEAAGASVLFGSGWPVGPLAPRLGLYAAVARLHADGGPEGGWIPEQKVSLESAVTHYTADPARAAGLAEQVGELLPGRLADLAVFDRDIFKDEGRSLPQAAVDMTIFDGKIVYERAAK